MYFAPPFQPLNPIKTTKMYMSRYTIDDLADEHDIFSQTNKKYIYANNHNKNNVSHCENQSQKKMKKDKKKNMTTKRTQCQLISLFSNAKHWNNI